MQKVVGCLRSVEERQVKKNLGILCAKLSQDEAGKQIGRDLNVLEILYGLK
jgi:tetrahydromethanopterin S-methyltransferase subunit G